MDLVIENRIYIATPEWFGFNLWEDAITPVYTEMAVQSTVDLCDNADMESCAFTSPSEKDFGWTKDAKESLNSLFI